MKVTQRGLISDCEESHPLFCRNFHQLVARFYLEKGRTVLTTQFKNNADPDPLSIWARRDTRALLVVDDDLNICWRNDAAVELLGRAPTVTICDGLLVPCGMRAKATFRSFVRASSERLSTLCLQANDTDHMLCTAISLVDGEKPRKTGISLRLTSDAVSVGAVTLEAAFSLTPSERTVVQTLLAGHTAEQIGSQLRLSVGTIRMHIRHIYDKLGVSSREAMFHKLIPFLPLR
jgi:DNA-binding CsgD family transcriptional regulator